MCYSELGVLTCRCRVVSIYRFDSGQVCFGSQLTFTYLNHLRSNISPKLKKLGNGCDMLHLRKQNAISRIAFQLEKGHSDQTHLIGAW